MVRFLLASFLIDLIINSRTVDDIHDCLEHLPSSLEEYYDATLGRITSQTDRRDVDYALTSLAWILHAKEPITWDALRRGVRMSLSNRRLDTLEAVEDNLLSQSEMLHVCMGLIRDPTANVSKEDYKEPLVSFIHSSVREYLHKHHDRLFPTAQHMITTACTNYLYLWV